MLQSHVKFHSTSGKRLILIVDDEQMNRELLGYIASSDFDVLYAENGEEAIRVLKENTRHISLVLLDLMMPGMDGYDVMRIMKNDEEYRQIPIIVLTSEVRAEVECLRLGASDFILKPFNSPEVILARMQKTIELYEDRNIIRSTERDELTGLFIKDFFFRYAEQFDYYHSDMPMDAVALDITHFHLINEMYGREAGDGVLEHMGAFIKDMILRTNGMACRREGDEFLLYIPHGKEDYEEMFVKLNSHFESYSEINVRTRGGIYLNADKDIAIERRFDRAVQAANRIKNDLTKNIFYYDSKIHESEIYAERLVNEIESAIAGNQYEIYYQPKYNIADEKPRLASAEALIRWNHPEFGMISPGIFIPLFENNGLIQQLDYYIWKTAASQIREWKDTLGVSVPISVNVSRMDLYHHGMVTYLQKILAENGLTSADMYLEITESAYTENSEQIIKMIDVLQSKGFMIEMDDFGTGYSSLNMLAEIPVDILKLDMRFARNLGSGDKTEKLVRMIMDIAEYLEVGVVAEGVEDKAQADFLKSVGCNIIQGYYFSKPLPACEFGKLLGESFGEKMT